MFMYFTTVEVDENVKYSLKLSNAGALNKLIGKFWHRKLEMDVLSYSIDVPGS